jgi:hypothetical protein
MLDQDVRLGRGTADNDLPLRPHPASAAPTPPSSRPAACPSCPTT